MAGVTGIGGLFFRSSNPTMLASWYHEHLGVDMSQGAWMQQSGPTVFAPFSEDTDYFGDISKQWMINFRVSDLTALTASLIQAGIEVETRPEWDSEIGRFARIHDPDGNPVELWQPAGPALV